MANHKSAKKRIITSEKRRQTNKWKTSRLRTEIKKIATAIDAGNKEEATKLFPQVQRLFAKLAKTSAMRKDTAARKISRLATKVSKL